MRVRPDLRLRTIPHRLRGDNRHPHPHPAPGVAGETKPGPGRPDRRLVRGKPQRRRGRGGALLPPPGGGRRPGSPVVAGRQLSIRRGGSKGSGKCSALVPAGGPAGECPGAGVPSGHGGQRRRRQGPGKAAGSGRTGQRSGAVSAGLPLLERRRRGTGCAAGGGLV